MSRWEPEQKTATRRRILDAAARLFREQGFAGTGIADVMRAAGLTVGGFYAHFDSKEGLLSAVLADGYERTRAMLARGRGRADGPTFAREVTRRYLSRAHRDDPGAGCPLPALAAEVSRQGAAPREDIEKYLVSFADELASKLPCTSRSGLAARDTALGLMALSVGGILLARAVESDELSDEILRACRRLAEAETKE